MDMGQRPYIILIYAQSWPTTNGIIRENTKNEREREREREIVI